MPKPGYAHRDREIVPILRRCLLSICLAAANAGQAATAAEFGEPIPSFAALEAAGAVIGEVRIDPQDVFDEADPRENYGLYLLANVLHIRTRESVIRRQLLFASGERVSQRVIEETERLLRGNSYLYDVTIRPVAFRNGIVDIEVRTRDTWSLQPGASYSRGGGSDTGVVSLEEKNFLGTGVSVGVAGSSSVDRSGSEFEIQHNQVFGSWTAFSYKIADYSDGSAESISLARPFYALDTRWALGASAATFDRIDSIYTNADIVAQYRHQGRTSEVFGGLSKGLVNGWVQRYLQAWATRKTFTRSIRHTPPRQYPPTKRSSTSCALRLIEDKYVKVFNRKDRAPRVLHPGLERLGADRAQFHGARSDARSVALLGRGQQGNPLRARRRPPRQPLVLRPERRRTRRWQFLGAAARYTRHGPRNVFYVAGSADAVKSRSDQLLGGDNGCAAIRCATRAATSASCSRWRSAFTPIGILSSYSASAARCSMTSAEPGAETMRTRSTRAGCRMSASACA
jgi:hypothetical protein